MDMPSLSSTSMNHAVALTSILSGDMEGSTILLILDAMPVPLVWFRLDDGGAVFVNRAFRGVFGYSTEEVRSWSHWSSCLPDTEQRERTAAQWAEQTRKRKDWQAETGLAVDQIEIRVLAGDGTERIVLHSGVVLPSINCMLAIYVDLTTRKRDELQLTHAQREAREHEVLYPLLLNHTREMLVLSSSSKVRCFVSPAVFPLLGWSQEEYLAQSLGDLVHAEDREAVLAMRGRCQQDATSQMLRHRMLRKNGSWLWVETLVSCYKDPATQEIMGYVATVRDDSHRKAEEVEHAAQTALLEMQAHYDNLTGLANRHLFYSTLHEEARRQSRSAQSLALLLIDVDYFKAFNDRYGHLEGDRVLQRVAAVLKTSAHRIADMAARFGGEEFVLFLPMTEPEGAAAIAQNTMEALAKEVIPHIGSPTGLLTISIGIACWPASTALDCDKLLLHADRALYKAKRLGRNQFCKEYCGYTELGSFPKLHVPKSHEMEALQRTGMEELLPEAG